MTKQEIVEKLKKDIACDEQKVCLAECDQCEYYVTRPELAEVEREVLKLLLENGDTTNVF